MNELAEKHIGLAQKEASKHCKHINKVLDFEDILQEAYYALIKATYSYNDHSGASFITYATIVIQRHLKRIQSQWNSVVSCGSESKTDGLLRKVVFDAKGKIPSATEIINKYKVTIYSAKSVLLKYRSQVPLRLDQKLYDSSMSVIDILDLGQYKRPDLMYERKDLVEYLLLMLRLLPLQWKILIDRRYFKDMSRQKIADIEGVSERAISYRLTRVINELKKEFDDE